MTKYLNIVCPKCYKLARVAYILSDSFSHYGKLNYSNGQMYLYYDDDSFNARLSVSALRFHGLWNLDLRCDECGQIIEDLKYIRAFCGLGQTGQRIEIDSSTTSFKPIDVFCEQCQSYSTIMTDGYITLKERGFVCIREDGKLIYVRIEASESLDDIYCEYSCCGEEIESHELEKISRDYHFRHNVDIVDIFEEHSYHCYKEQNRFDLLDIEPIE